MDLLPVGTIVEFAGGQFMIAGIGLISDNKSYKYALVPYPMGTTYDDSVLLTDEVDKKIFMGYENEEFETLKLLFEAYQKNSENFDK